MPSMRYSSVAGPRRAARRSLVATGRHRVIYRPAPTLGTRRAGLPRGARGDRRGCFATPTPPDPTAGHLADIDRAVRLAGRRGRRLRHGHLRRRLRLARHRQAAARHPTRRAAGRAARVGPRARARRCSTPRMPPRPPRSWTRRSHTPTTTHAALVPRYFGDTTPGREHGALPGGLLAGGEEREAALVAARRDRGRPASRRPVESREHAASARPGAACSPPRLLRARGQEWWPPSSAAVTPHFCAAALRSARTCWRCSLVSGPHGRVTAASSQAAALLVGEAVPEGAGLGEGQGRRRSSRRRPRPWPRRAARSASSSGPTGRVICASCRQVRCSSVSLFHQPRAAARGVGAVGAGPGDGVRGGADAGASGRGRARRRRRPGPGSREALEATTAPVAIRAVPTPTATRVVRRRVMVVSLRSGCACRRWRRSRRRRHRPCRRPPRRRARRARPRGSAGGHADATCTSDRRGPRSVAPARARSSSDGRQRPPSCTTRQLAVPLAQETLADPLGASDVRADIHRKSRGFLQTGAAASGSVAAMTTESPRPTVLVVDDEENIAYLVSSALRLAELDVATAAPARRRSPTCTPAYPDLVVLDVMLPDLDGFEVLRRLRAKGVEAPVLFLTARTDTADRVRGLTAGGDDYIVKPFALEELVARVHVALRRRGAAPAPSGRHQVHDLVLDEDQHRVWRGDTEHHLTATEFTLLRCLLVNAGRVVTRAQILDHVWQYDFAGESRDHRVVRLDAAQEGRRHRTQADPHGARRRLHDPGTVMTLRRRLRHRHQRPGRRAARRGGRGRARAAGLPRRPPRRPARRPGPEPPRHPAGLGPRRGRGPTTHRRRPLRRLGRPDVAPTAPSPPVLTPRERPRPGPAARARREGDRRRRGAPRHPARPVGCGW